ncbi:TAFII55 protein conserved region-domain-containing protein [Coemansia spiralis]|nr:TAFII55 protein conserved region-domain-containing protein [Coemansia spiralis]
MPYHPPRPRGRPPLGDRQRNRLTLKLSGASRGPEPKPEIDESEAPMEEQFVLRVLPEMSVRFSKLVAERQIHDHLEIKFRDERNAVVKFDNEHYVARLVDLPTITESYRTLDKKQMLKTADICQMLIIERKVTAAEIDQVPLARGIDIIHPDGLAPSLADVRWSRFRPRIPRSRIDAIEKEVLRLLEDDAQAMAVKFEICDDQGEDGRATPSIDIMSPVTLDDLNTPMVADEDAASSVAEDMEFDENLAAELEQGLEELDDDDDEDDESEEEDEEEFQPNNERAMQMKLLGEEIAELERTIVKKNADLGSAPNPIIYRRFEDIIQRLQQELEAKKQQLEHYNKELEDESRQQQQRGEEESKE